MMSHRKLHAGQLARLAFVVLFAFAFMLGGTLPGHADVVAGGGGTPPSSPADTTANDGGTSSYDGGSADTEAVATQDAVDASWLWTVDLLLLTSSAVM